MLKWREFKILSKSDTDFQCPTCSKTNFMDALPFLTLSDSDLISLFPINNSSNNIPPSKNLFSHAYSNPSDIKQNCYSKFKLSFLSVNIRSLNKNIDKLRRLLKNLNFTPDIISIAETWINDQKPPLYGLNGYQFIYNDCTCHVGGVGFFIKDSLKYNITTKYNIVDDRCENLWIELTLRNDKNITFGSIYRHPDYDYSEFQTQFASTIEALNRENKTFLIGGDINIDLTKTKSSSYINEIESQGSWQTVNYPTRIVLNQTSSLIDHIYTNLPPTEIITKTIAYELSDHLPNITFINSHRKNFHSKEKILVRDTKNFVEENFLSDLEQNLNTNLQITNNANENWNEFLKLFTSEIDRHAPMKQLSRREQKLHYKPYITPEILKSIKIKQKMYKEIISNHNKNNDSSKWTEYKKNTEIT